MALVDVDQTRRAPSTRVAPCARARGRQAAPSARWRTPLGLRRAGRAAGVRTIVRAGEGAALRGHHRGVRPSKGNAHAPRRGPTTRACRSARRPRGRRGSRRAAGARRGRAPRRGTRRAGSVGAPRGRKRGDGGLALVLHVGVVARGVGREHPRAGRVDVVLARLVEVGEDGDQKRRGARARPSHTAARGGRRGGGGRWKGGNADDGDNQSPPRIDVSSTGRAPRRPRPSGARRARIRRAQKASTRPRHSPRRLMSTEAHWTAPRSGKNR